MLGFTPPDPKYSARFSVTPVGRDERRTASFCIKVNIQDTEGEEKPLAD